jgi:hypothetical protein
MVKILVRFSAIYRKSPFVHEPRKVAEGTKKKAEDSPYRVLCAFSRRYSVAARSAKVDTKVLHIP